MHTHLTTFFCLTLVLPSSAISQTLSPVYAIYGIKNVSPGNQVTSINVGVIPTGNQAECFHQIEVYEEGMHKRGIPATIQLLPSKCTSVLNSEFQAMVQGQRIKDVYVVVASGEWRPVFTAWYNIPPSDPAAVCKKLIVGMRVTLSPSRANLDCRPPL